MIRTRSPVDSSPPAKRTRPDPTPPDATPRPLTPAWVPADAAPSDSPPAQDLANTLQADGPSPAGCAQALQPLEALNNPAHRLESTGFRAQVLARAIPLARTPDDVLALLDHLDMGVLVERPHLLFDLAQVVVVACGCDPDVLVHAVHFCVAHTTDSSGMPSPFAPAVVMFLVDSLGHLRPAIASHCLQMIASMVAGRDDVMDQQIASAWQALQRRALPDAVSPPPDPPPEPPGPASVGDTADWVGHLAEHIDPHFGLGAPTHEFARRHRQTTQELGTYLDKGQMLHTAYGTRTVEGMNMYAPSAQDGELTAIRQAGRAYLQAALVNRSWHAALVPTLQTAWLTYMAALSMYVHPTAIRPLMRRLDTHDSDRTAPPFPLPKVLRRMAQMEGTFDNWTQWLPALFQGLEPPEALAVLRSAFETLGELLQSSPLDDAQREALQAFPGTVLAMAYRHWLPPDEEAFEALADLVLARVTLSPQGSPFAPLLDLAMIFATDPERGTAVRTALLFSGRTSASAQAMGRRWLHMIEGGVPSATPAQTAEILDELEAMPAPLGAAYLLMLGELCAHARSPENDPRLIVCIQRLLEDTAWIASFPVSLSASFMYDVFPPHLLLEGFKRCKDSTQRVLMMGIEVKPSVMPLVFHLATKDLDTGHSWYWSWAYMVLESLNLQTASEGERETIKALLAKLGSLLHY